MRRISNYNNGSEVVVEIAPVRSRFQLIFIPLWLVGWAFGWFSAADSIVSDTPVFGKVFLLVWISGWSVAGIIVTWWLAWKAVGKEIIASNKNELTIKRSILGFGKTEKYNQSEILNLRARGYFGYDNKRDMREQMGLSGGVVAFNTNRKLVKFGAHLSEVEALEVVRLLKSV